MIMAAFHNQLWFIPQLDQSQGQEVECHVLEGVREPNRPVVSEPH